MENSNQTITFYGVGSHNKNAIVERKIQTLTLGNQALLLHVKIYFPEAITTKFFAYALKDFAEQLNLLQVYYDVIAPMEKFSGTKNRHYY